MPIIFALVSAVSAGFVSISIKIGLKGVDSNLGTFLRTLIVIIFAAIFASIVGGFYTLSNMTLLGWITLSFSGIFTALSWLCGFKALQVGQAHKVIVIDKLSTVLTMGLAIIILSEPFWWLTFVAMGIILTGTMLMVIKPKSKTIDDDINENFKPHKIINAKSKSWVLFAILALVFASFTAILASIGMNSVYYGKEPVAAGAATFYRTSIVALLSLCIVLGTKKMKNIKTFSRRNWIFIIISGILTGVSWLAFFAALQIGNVSIVVPIDRLSIIISVVGATIMFKEKLNWIGWLGLAVLTIGTLLLLI
ncbi:MAG: EamA family transporter [Firmicutes bacterium]|nr:EamA family transporter [Bacillota bacterium]